MIFGQSYGSCNTLCGASYQWECVQACVPPAKLHSLWDLWERLWCNWQLLGHSVSVQWVPSHVGVQGNEQADHCTQQRATAALPIVREAKSVLEAWQELGLEEMFEHDESGMAAYGWRGLRESQLE